MKKKLDLSKSVYELTEEYPELIDILASLGFSEIKNSVMRSSVGKIMTIPKGASLKGISMSKVVFTLMSKGFSLTGKMPDISLDEEQAKEEKSEDKLPSNKEKLKAYLKRLNEGEELESVRADFSKAFSSVSAAEIMQAEQDLIAEGVPLNEAKKLCDVHSALFHGATNAEKAGESRAYVNKEERARELSGIKGHPLYTFTRENEKISELIQETLDKIEKNEDISPEVQKLREISVHYAKKGDLLYPHLKTNYEISGPSNVMWTVDDEIRDEITRLSKSKNRDEDFISRLKAVLKRAEEMVYKENNILFPICAVNFTKEEWQGIYEDSKDYAPCLGVMNEAFDETGEKSIIPTHFDGKEVVMNGGHINLEQLTHILNTIPLEITFVDDKNINRYFNEGPKVFKRANMAIDRDVFSCHPPKIEQMVRGVIEELRSGERESVDIWMEKQGKPFLVRYMAIRNREKEYLGVMEVVQDMGFAREHFEK